MNAFGSFGALQQAVRDARDAAKREARKSCGRGFFQSRGAEFSVAGPVGKLNEGGVWCWDGTKRGLESDIANLRAKYSEATAIYLEGGFNFAENLRDDCWDPLVSEWALMVWSA